jgi:hypothetical protein
MIRTSYRLAATIGGAFLIAGTLVLMTLGPASGLLGAGSQVSQPPIGVCGGPHVPSVARAPAPGRIEDRDEVAGCA